jgi:hypothetical protein
VNPISAQPITLPIFIFLLLNLNQAFPRATTQLTSPGFWGRSNSCEDEAKSAKFSLEARERTVRLVGSRRSLRTKEKEQQIRDG